MRSIIASRALTCVAVKKEHNSEEIMQPHLCRNEGATKKCGCDKQKFCIELDAMITRLGTICVAVLRRFYSMSIMGARRGGGK